MDNQKSAYQLKVTNGKVSARATTMRQKSTKTKHACHMYIMVEKSTQVLEISAIQKRRNGYGICFSALVL